MVGMTGFEPAASASRTQRSTKLSHIPKTIGLYHYRRHPSTNFFTEPESPSSVCRFDLDQIRIARLSVSDAARNHNFISAFQMHPFFCNHFC